MFDKLQGEIGRRNRKQELEQSGQKDMMDVF
jgi:hypothetical protein